MNVDQLFLNIWKNPLKFLSGQTARLRSGPALSYLACYGGGVILATCFTHMMPEVDRFLARDATKTSLFKSKKQYDWIFS